MLGKFLDQGMDVKTALQTIIETKLIGTWRIAVMVVAEPNKLFFTEFLKRAEETSKKI